MQRYFFHIWSKSHGRSYDELGLNFPSTEAACREALRAAQDLISVFAARGQDPRDHAIEIENEAGEVVLHLPFSEIFLRDVNDAAGATVASPQQGYGKGQEEQDGAT
jgi:hypothetical protein